MPAPTDTHQGVPTRTYSLAEIALILCGSDGPTEQRWLSDRLRGYEKPALSGLKVQGKWRMTEADLAAAVEILRPRRNEIQIPAMTSMTARSQRRLAV